MSETQPLLGEFHNGFAWYIAIMSEVCLANGVARMVGGGAQKVFVAGTMILYRMGFSSTKYIQ